MPVRNIQGLKGLTKADRQAWENEQLVNLGSSFNDYNEAEKDRIYRNQQFSDALQDREEYEDWLKLPSAERDRIFANVAFTDAFGDSEDYDRLASLSPEERDRHYINTDIMNRAEQRWGRDEWNKPEWEQMQKLLTPTELNSLLEADWNTQAERDRNYINSLKAVNGEAYDKSALLARENLAGETGESLSGLDVAKAFNKALNTATSYAINPRNWGWGTNLKALTIFGDTFTNSLPGGDTTTRRLAFDLKSAASSALGATFGTPVAMLSDVKDFLGSLETVYDPVTGQKTLKTSDKTKDFKDTNTAKLWRERTYGQYNDYINMVNNAQYEDAIARSAVERTQMAKEVGLKDKWEDYLSKAVESDPQAISTMWDNTIEMSPYGKAFKDEYQLRLTDAEKVDIISQWRSVADMYGEEIAAATLDNTMRNLVADRTTIDDRAKNLGINIGCQTLGVIGGAITGTGSLARSFDEQASELYRQGFRMDDGKLKQLWAWHNPTYWNSVAQYGTLNPNAIRRYKYGVGSDEYNEALAEYAQQAQALNPDVQLNPEEVEEEFQAQWIKQQYEQGKFKGDQISTTVTIRRAEDEGQLFGDQSLAEGLGMAGQMMGQYTMQAPSFIVGALAKSGRIVGATANVAQKGSAALGLIAPTVAISEAYAQGNYEQTLQKNREAWDKYINSPEFSNRIVEEVQTPEFQQQVTDTYNANAEYYNAAAKKLNPTLTENKDIVAFGRQLAQGDLTEQRVKEINDEGIGHVTDGALSAYWTSFAIEALRYGHFFTTYRQFIFGDTTKKLGLGKNTWHVRKSGAVNDLTSKAIARNFGKEALYSGWTNYLDETTSAFATGIGTQIYNDYLGMYYHNNPEYNNSFGHLMAGIHSASNSFVEDSSIRAGIIGTMGFLTGGNFANAATAWIAPQARTLTSGEIAERMKSGMSLKDASQLSTEEAREELKQKLGFHGGADKYGKGRVALEWAAYLTGNSALQNISQQLQESDYNKILCKELNEYIAQHDELLNSNETARALFNSCLARQDAKASGDELLMKNAAYLQAFNIFKVLHEMRQLGTEESETYQNFMDQMSRYEQGEIGYNDIDMFLHNPLNTEDMSQYTDTEVEAIARERIQKNAVKFRELSESWEKNSESLAKVFGTDIAHLDGYTRSIYYDALFKMGQADDMQARLQNMEESLSGSREVNTNINEVVQYGIAQEGTKAKIVNTLLDSTHKQVEKLNKEIEKAKAKKAKDAQEEEVNKANLLFMENQKNRLQDIIHKLSADKVHLSSRPIETRVMSKDEIMHLSPEERLFVFTSPEVFSDEQQQVIEEARTDLLKQFGDDYLSKLRDTHLLNERIKINNNYLNTLLSGGIADATLNLQAMELRNAMESVQSAAKEAIQSLVPMLSKDGISDKLLSTAIGMPATTLKDAADELRKVNPVKADALENLAMVVNKIKDFDTSIELAIPNAEDKKKVSKLLTDVIKQSQNLLDLPKLFMDFLSNNEVSWYDRDLVMRVLEKHSELIRQQEATQNNNENEVKKEAKGESESKGEGELGAEDKLIEHTADKEVGKFKSPTPEQLAPLNPDTAPITSHNAGPVDEVGKTLENIQGTALQGNWINGYDVNILRDTGKQVLKKGTSENSIFSRWLEWSKLNGYRYQDVIDFELSKILASDPAMPIHMMVVNKAGEATQDAKVNDAIMLVIEATDAVKKVHNEEYGHYISVGGKDYLLIGRAGIERVHTTEQEDNYKAMDKAIRAERDASNSSERFFVSDKYSTQVRYVNGGNITTALAGETEATRDIMDMLGDAIRDPFGIGKLENLGWYVQVGTEAREPIHLPSKVVREGNYYIPNDRAYNQGAVFAMVPAGNGKYMPIKINAATLTNIKDGRFKDIVRNSVEKLTSPNYETRHEGIVELLKLVVLDDSTNILIGSSEINGVTIVMDGEKQKSFLIGKDSPQEIVNAIMQVPFRININQTTFQDPVRMKQLAEAGAFTTVVAVLGATGNNYTVYACDTDGKPMKESTNVGNAGYTAKTPTRSTVLPYKGAMARFKDGKWIVEESGKETRVVTSPSEIQALDCAAQIEEQRLVPVESKGNFKYYILSADMNAPLVVKRDIYTGEVIIPTRDAMKSYIQRAEKIQQEKKATATRNERNEAAAAKGVKMSIGETPVQTTENVEANNEERAAKGVKMNIQLGEEPNKVPNNEQGKPSEATRKVVNDLHKSEKSRNFVELYHDTDFYEVIDDLLVEKFGDELPSSDDGIVKFLQSKNIPTENIDNIDAWIDLVENCR